MSQGERYVRYVHSQSTSTLMVCFIINYHTPGLTETLILTADVGNLEKPFFRPEGDI